MKWSRPWRSRLEPSWLIKIGFLFNQIFDLIFDQIFDQIYISYGAEATTKTLSDFSLFQAGQIVRKIENSACHVFFKKEFDLE